MKDEILETAALIPLPSTPTESVFPSSLDEGDVSQSILLEDRSSQPEAEPPVNVPMGKRQRSSSFAIFVDPDCSEHVHKKVVASFPGNIPASKKNTVLKKSGLKKSKKSAPKIKTPMTGKNRIPLAELQDDNSSPSVSPRDAGTPFVFNPSDPWWEEKENHVEYTPYIPAPISTRSPGQPPVFTQSGFSNTDDSTENAKHRINPRPRSMVLYHELEIEDWGASTETINSAFLSVALKVHPDKVSGDKELAAAATKKMQRVLAARHVLLDEAQRHKYDVDGILPATWPSDD